MSENLILTAGINLQIGDKHMFNCPICDNHSERFLPDGRDSEASIKLKIIGAGYRENARCPHCSSKDRERLIWLFLMTLNNLNNPKTKLLDVSPSKALKKAITSKTKVEYYDIDLVDSRSRIKMDLTDLKFEDNFFDIVICSHVLEHIKDDLKGMREIYRVLKPGGIAILQSPISAILLNTYEDETAKSGQLREKLFGQDDHVRVYGADYCQRVNSVGFELKVLGQDQICPDPEYDYALIKDEKLYLGLKRE